MPLPSPSAHADWCDLKQLMAPCIRLGEFTLTSGKTSDLYFDGRELSLSGAAMPLIGRVINHMIRDEPDLTHIGGPTLGADPILTAAVLIGRLEFGRRVDGFIVRKAAKAHGTGKRIEGPALGATSRVVLVEDTVTTGGSVLEACAVVAATGATIVGVIALFDREEGASEAFEQAGVSLVPVYRRSDFAQLAT